MRGTSAGTMLVAGASVVRKWLVAPESRMAHRLMVAVSVVVVLRRTEATSAYLWVGVKQQVELIVLINLSLPAPLSEVSRLLIGGIVRLLVGSWLLHHLRVRGIWCWVLLSDKIHHALAGLLCRHVHGRPHTVRATARLNRALDSVV